MTNSNYRENYPQSGSGGEAIVNTGHQIRPTPPGDVTIKAGSSGTKIGKVNLTGKIYFNGVSLTALIVTNLILNAIFAFVIATLVI